MLRLEAVEAAYGDSQVLFGVELEVRDGEVVTLLGRNGMGKTTTVHAIMGVVPVRRGRITFEGKPIHELPSFRISRTGLALVPEGRQIFPNLTVRENLVAAASNWRQAANPWKLDSVRELFPALGRLMGRMGGQLSGGEQQMLAIGRALMTNPKLLILDEATEGLAPKIRAEIWACLDKLKHAGQAVLLIDKNIKAISRFADRHYILEKGRVVWSGSSAALLEDRELRPKYLGV